MEPQMNQDDNNIEALIEAQARGEMIQAVPVENSVLPEPELDARLSKLAVQPSGFLTTNVDVQPSGFSE